MFASGWSVEYDEQGISCIWFEIQADTFMLASICLAGRHLMAALSHTIVIAESNKWMQSELLGLHKLFAERARNHCSWVLSGACADVPNIWNGKLGVS